MAGEGSDGGESQRIDQATPCRTRLKRGPRDPRTDANAQQKPTSVFILTDNLPLERALQKKRHILLLKITDNLHAPPFLETGFGFFGWEQPAEVVAQFWSDVPDEGKDDQVGTVLLVLGIGRRTHGGHALDVVEKLSYGQIIGHASDTRSD